MPQSKKTHRQLARRKYGGTSDLLTKTRFKDENDNLSASIKKKFEFSFNKLHEVLNQLEEKGVECELISSIRNWVSDNNSLINDGKQHPACS